MATTAVADTRAPAPLPPAPRPVPAPTLLAQAEEALRQARAEEHRIRRGVQDPAQPVTWDDLGRCEAETRRSQALVNARQRATAQLVAAIPSARIAARRAQGDLATLEEQMRRSLIKARRDVQLTRDELDQMIHDLTRIAGEAAVPRED